MTNHLKTAVLISPLATLAGSACQPPQQQSGELPNILCLVCEDIGPYLSCYGDPLAVTPNLDRFASEGIRYTRMFTTVGVSAPSRASLITGHYSTSIGANNMRTINIHEGVENGIEPYEAVPEAGIKCYPEYMRQAGYFCTNSGKTDYQFLPPVTAWDQNGRNAHWKNRPEGAPFFSIFNIGVTHESNIWLRADEPLVVSPDDVTPPPYHPDDEISRKDWAVVYSNICEMDRQVQRYIDEVEEAGLLDNTIIIWYSDNGGPMPRQKRALYDSGTLVPFMVRFPDGRMAGSVDEGMHMFIDIPATILSLAGIEVPENMHGRPFLGEYAAPARDYVYGARDRFDEKLECQRAVRDENFRYLRNYMPERPLELDLTYPKGIPTVRHIKELYARGTLGAIPSQWLSPRPVEEFYDLRDDPHEVNNLIDDPKYAADIARLKSELASWQAEYDKMVGRPEAELRDQLWPGGVQPQVGEPQFSVRRGKLTIENPTEGASIAYRVNGKGTVEGGWYLYSKPVEVSEGDVVTVVCTRIGYKPTAEVTYTI
jgi:arylsulfatase A-like enzyme